MEKKTQFFMGKLTISTGQFSSLQSVTNYQRVIHQLPLFLSHRIPRSYSPLGLVQLQAFHILQMVSVDFFRYMSSTIVHLWYAITYCQQLCFFSNHAPVILSNRCPFIYIYHLHIMRQLEKNIWFRLWELKPFNVNVIKTYDSDYENYIL